MHENKASQKLISSTENVFINNPETNSPAVSDTSIQYELVGDSQIGRKELENFFLLSIDLLCIAGFDGYFKCLNPAWTKILGYSNAELLAKPYLEFVHPEDRSATIAEAKKLVTDCDIINFQNRYRCKDGTYRWLSWNAKVVPGERLAYCVARDITESKQQEKTLRASEQQLKLAFEVARMGSWNWNIQTGQIKWSNNLEALFGLAPGEFDGSYEMFVSTIYSEDRDRVLKAIENAVATGADYDLEFRIVYPNGQIRWALSQGKVFYDRNGQPIQMIGVDLDITERKRLEQQLHQSIEHLSNLKFALDRSGIVAIRDRQGIITEVNDRFCQLSQYSPEELLGRDRRIVNSGYHPPSFSKDLWSTISRGKVWKGEINNRAKDGTDYWVDTTIVPFLDECGQPVQYLAIGFDITARKQVEEELRQNEERWQLALNGNNDGIWDWNVRTNEVFFSTRWKEMLGYEEQEISNHLDEWSKRVHPDDLEATIQAVQDHLTGKTEYYVSEHRVQCKEGSYKWILDRGKALWDQAGNPVRMVGSHTDITERKAAEKLLKKQAVIFESISEGIIVTDLEGRIVDWNPAAEKMFGYTLAEVLGKTPAILHRPEESSTLTQQILEAIKRENFWSGEIVFIRQDGTEGVSETVVVPLCDDSGQMVATIGINRDLTEKKRREKILHNTMLGVSAQTGEAFFQLLVKYLTQALEIEYAFISEAIELRDDCDGKIKPSRMRTIAGYGHGRVIENFEYDLVDTLCESVFGQKILVYPDRIQQLFPKDTALVKMGVESYVGVPLFDSNGQTLGLLAVLSTKPLVDTKWMEEVIQIFAIRVSSELERRQAEQYLKQQAQIINQIHDGVMATDLDGYITSWNKGAERLFGYRADEILGQHIGIVYPEEQQQFLQENIIAPLLERKMYETEAIGQKKSGETFDAYLSLSLQKDERNNTIGMISYSMDIAEAEPIDEPGPRIIYVNEAFTDITGYTLEELRNNSPRILQGDKTQRSELDKIRYALENYQSVRVELVNYRKDGSEFWVEINITPVADETGCYTHWVSVQRDITERKRAEEKLQLQMSRSQLFTEISLKIRQSLQLEDILKTTTNELQKLLDADRVLILRLEAPKTLYVVRETVRSGWDSVIERGFCDDCLDEEYLIKYPQGRLYSFDVENLSENHCLIGFLRYFHVKSKLVIPLLLHERLWGTIVIHQCSHTRNWSNWEIDLLKQIANQIGIALGQSNLLEALSNSKQRWATLTETAPVGIFLTDAEGNCLYVNHSWCEIAGMSIQEASGRGWTKALHPEDRDRVFSEWYRAAHNSLPFASEYRFVHPDGKITWVYGQAIAETTPDGSVTGYIGTLTNITERLKMEEMKRALEREKKMSQLKLRFFSMASHEFRTPLSIITFATQVLENSEPEWLDDKKIRNINRIKDSAQKITQMLTEVLMLARAEAKKLEIKPKTLNLQQFCQQILEEVKTERTENCAISLVNQGNRNDEVYLDEKLLHSILINLLSNAVKYSPQGEKIDFEVKLQTKSVIFTIKDRGIGIPLEDQAHLFETFHRGENVGEIDGTGLGLAIVKRCVDLQGGQITCESYPGKGTTFIVSLPISGKKLRSQT